MGQNFPEQIITSSPIRGCEGFQAPYGPLAVPVQNQSFPTTRRTTRRTSRFPVAPFYLIFVAVAEPIRAGRLLEVVSLFWGWLVFRGHKTTVCQPSTNPQDRGVHDHGWGDIYIYIYIYICVSVCVCLCVCVCMFPTCMCVA